jgi:hypothetical protein
MGTIKTYRSQDGRAYFVFRFEPVAGHVDVVCTRHPPLGGRDPGVGRTHLYSSGQVCFVSGREPRSQLEAERRAAEWAEYLLSYIRTGVAR